MQLGMIGLLRAGGNIVRRLLGSGHSAIVFDKDTKAVTALSGEGASAAATLSDFVSTLERPRTAWAMLPAGLVTEAMIDALSRLMRGGDVIDDGGNTFWRDDVRRGKALKEIGLHYLDVGTSGGFGEKILSAMRAGFGGHKEPQQRKNAARKTAPDIVKPKATCS